MAESCTNSSLKTTLSSNARSAYNTNAFSGGDLTSGMCQASWKSVTLADDFRSPSLYDEDSDVFRDITETVESLQPWKHNETIEGICEHDIRNFSKCVLERRASIVDDLLFEIYDRWHDTRRDSFDSDFTECSSTSEFFHGRHSCIEEEGRNSDKLNRAVLEAQNEKSLRGMITELQHRINQTNVRLVRQLKRRDRRLAKLQHNCDIVTAILQAASLKRPLETPDVKTPGHQDTSSSGSQTVQKAKF